jgi:hypothetical protein
MLELSGVPSAQEAGDARFRVTVEQVASVLQM